MKQLLSIFFLILSLESKAQELFAVTEPASNRPAGSISIRTDHLIMDERASLKTNYHLIPEIAVGLSKKLMLKGNLFFSNRNKNFDGEGGSLYVKYRFLSHDAVQKHFRMAAFARLSYNNSDIHQEEITLYGHNTGWEAGIVATQLLQKVAVSSSLALVQATDNGRGNKYPYGRKNSQALNSTFSLGKLMLPKAYTAYRQTNINLMAEVLTQINMGTGQYYADFAPSIQLIFNSQSRIDIGYKTELTGTLLRTAANGFFIRLEHNFFNVF